VGAGCYVPAGDGGAGAPGLLSISLLSTRALTASGTLRVTGSGMDPVTAAIRPGESSKTLEVPAGTARKVELEFPLRSVTLGGSATVDLSPAQTKTVPLSLNVVATQILVSDTSNARLVQIDDMDGTGWKAISAFDFSPAAQFYDFFPVVVDFDSQGRLYIFNFSGSETSTIPDGIIRIPDIDHPEEFEIILRASEYPLMNYIIDREKDILYFIRNDIPGLFMLDLNTAGSPQLFGEPDDQEWLLSGYAENFSPGPISVDSQGRIYMAGVSSLNHVIVRVDMSRPAGSRLKFFDPALYTGSIEIYSPQMDITVKGNYLYASYPESGTMGGPAIVAFDLDLVPRLSFGQVTSTPAASGDFVYPFLFIRSVGPSVHIIDDDQNGAGYDRVVSFTDGTGAGWDTYGQTGTGIGQFQFIETP
jgi:hypothetical protein